MDGLLVRELRACAICQVPNRSAVGPCCMHACMHVLTFVQTVVVGLSPPQCVPRCYLPECLRLGQQEDLVCERLELRGVRGQGGRHQEPTHTYRGEGEPGIRTAYTPTLYLVTHSI